MKLVWTVCKEHALTSHEQLCKYDSSVETGIYPFCTLLVLTHVIIIPSPSLPFLLFIISDSWTCEADGWVGGGGFQHVPLLSLYKLYLGPRTNHRPSPSDRRLLANQRKISRKQASEHQPLLLENIYSQHDVENNSSYSVSAVGWSWRIGQPFIWSEIMRPGVHPCCNLYLRRLSMETLYYQHR